MLKKIRDKKNKGFTLAELLIVVAIIAVLVAIAIPIFTAQLEKSREATDEANIRAAYAEVSASLLEWDGTSSIDPVVVTKRQSQDNWQSHSGDATIDINKNLTGVKVAKSKWTIKANTTDNKVEIEADE